MLLTHLTPFLLHACTHTTQPKPNKFRKKSTGSWRNSGPVAIRRPFCTGSKRRNGTGRDICTRRGFIRVHSSWRPITPKRTTPTAAGTASTLRRQLRPIDFVRLYRGELQVCIITIFTTKKVCRWLKLSNGRTAAVLFVMRIASPTLVVSCIVRLSTAAMGCFPFRA